MKVSLADVSKKAGVSSMTVSRVIRDQGSVSDNARQKVICAVKELGYLPSQAARSLRGKKHDLNNDTMCCCLIFGKETQVGDAFFRDIARAAENQAIEHGLCLLQTHWQDAFEASWRRLAAVASVPGLGGLILAGQFSADDIHAVKKYSQNVVIIDGPVPSGFDIASVQADYYSGSTLALEHLISRGAKRILVITGPEKKHYFAKAMKAAAAQYSAQCEKIEVIDSELTLACGVNIISDIFQKGGFYDAVFTNDEVALGVLRALNQLGVKVPHDVKIIGFDNISYAAYSSPSLTTIHIDKSLLGREAVKSLIEQIHGNSDRKSVQVKKVIKASLVVRESTGG